MNTSVPITGIIVELKEKGLSHQQIANQVGWKKTSIRTYLQRLRHTEATPKQKKLLKKFKYDSEISKYEAIILINKLLK